MRATLSIIVPFVVSITAASHAMACMYPTVYFSRDSSEMPIEGRRAIEDILWIIAEQKKTAPNCPIELRLSARIDGAEAAAGRTALDVARAGSVVMALRERLPERVTYKIMPLGFDLPFEPTPVGVASPLNRSVEIRIRAPADGRQIVCEGPVSSCMTCAIVMEDGSKCPY
jgi:hypothetical protein